MKTHVDWHMRDKKIKLCASCYIARDGLQCGFGLCLQTSIKVKQYVIIALVYYREVRIHSISTMHPSLNEVLFYVLHRETKYQILSARVLRRFA